ncbi:hypothetical protein T484DRAFT_1787812 [Baffinella frigidus]|nr:hypothetical protein T484DRAFT_1787812 [Cryptophyta sp. CCMP2293]
MWYQAVCLIAVDLTTTIEGTFKSVSADMTVTSKKRTSVEFWEKSANKVCLTAAKGSLFVDDACNSVCAMRTANSTRRRDLLGQPGPPSMPLDLDSLPTPDRGASLRTLGANTITIDGLEIVDPITIDGLEIVDPVASDPRVPWVCTGDPATDEVFENRIDGCTGINLTHRFCGILRVESAISASA